MRNYIIMIFIILPLTFGAGCSHGDNIAPQLILVNGVMYYMYDNSAGIAQMLDDSWVFVGKVESCVRSDTQPRRNLQSNHSIVGAEVYHSNEGYIRIANSSWGDPLKDAVTGDSIIVVFEGQFSLYLSEEAHADVLVIMDAAKRHSLMVDGVIYSLMSTTGGENISIPDSFVYLGKVESAVPIDEFPTENLQANRDIVVGASVYRLPIGEESDIVVFHTANLRFYYKHLPRS